MTGDEMEIINPVTTGRKFTVGVDNQVIDNHECTFSFFNEDAKCIICGKSLGDFIAEDKDPTRPRIPIILTPQEEIIT
jgi:hypothetical protein